MARRVIQDLQAPSTADIRPQNEPRDGFFLARTPPRQIGAIDFASLSQTLQRGLADREVRVGTEDLQEAMVQEQERLAGLQKLRETDMKAWLTEVAKGNVHAGGNPYANVGHARVKGRAIADAYGQAVTDALNQELVEANNRGDTALGIPKDARNFGEIAAEKRQEIFKLVAAENPELVDDIYMRREFAGATAELDKKLAAAFNGKVLDLRAENTAQAWGVEIRKGIESLASATSPEEISEAIGKLQRDQKDIASFVPNAQDRFFEFATVGLVQMRREDPENGSQKFLDAMGNLAETKLTGTADLGSTGQYQKLMAQAADAAEQDKRQASHDKPVKVQDLWLEHMQEGGVAYSMVAASSIAEVEEIEKNLVSLYSGKPFAGEMITKTRELARVRKATFRGEQVEDDRVVLASSDSALYRGDIAGALQIASEVGDDASRISQISKVNQAKPELIKEAWTTTRSNEVTARLNTAIGNRLRLADASLKEYIAARGNRETQKLQLAYAKDITEVGREKADENWEAGLDKLEKEHLQWVKEEQVNWDAQDTAIRDGILEGRTIDALVANNPILEEGPVRDRYERMARDLDNRTAASLSAATKAIEDVVSLQFENTAIYDAKSGGYTGETGKYYDPPTSPVLFGSPPKVPNSAGKAAIALEVDKSLRGMRAWMESDEGKRARLELLPSEFAEVVKDKALSRSWAPSFAAKTDEPYAYDPGPLKQAPTAEEIRDQRWENQKARWKTLVDPDTDLTPEITKERDARYAAAKESHRAALEEIASGFTESDKFPSRTPIGPEFPKNQIRFELERLMDNPNSVRMSQQSAQLRLEEVQRFEASLVAQQGPGAGPKHDTVIGVMSDLGVYAGLSPDAQRAVQDGYYIGRESIYTPNILKTVKDFYGYKEYNEYPNGSAAPNATPAFSLRAADMIRTVATVDTIVGTLPAYDNTPLIDEYSTGGTWIGGTWQGPFVTAHPLPLAIAAKNARYRGQVSLAQDFEQSFADTINQWVSHVTPKSDPLGKLVPGQDKIPPQGEVAREYLEIMQFTHIPTKWVKQGMLAKGLPIQPGMPLIPSRDLVFASEESLRTTMMEGNREEAEAILKAFLIGVDPNAPLADQPEVRAFKQRQRDLIQLRKY